MRFTHEIGLGTKNVPRSNIGASFIKNAIKKGYRYIATSPSYRNEKEIGRGIANSRIDRRELFVTSYVYIDAVKDTHQFVIDTVLTSLKNLRLDYLDLILIHSYDCKDVKDMWEFISEAYDTDLNQKVMYIGVFNYDIKRLQMILGGEKKNHMQIALN